MLAMRRIWMHLLQSRGQQSILAARGHLTPPCSAWMQTGNYVSVLSFFRVRRCRLLGHAGGCGLPMRMKFLVTLLVLWAF